MVKAGVLWGTHIHISPWTLLLLVGCALFGLFEEVVVWLCALVAHEMGHLMLAAALGYSFPRLDLKPYGGVMQSNASLPLDALGQATVALAGPLANFMLLSVCLAASRWMNHEAHMLRSMVDINLALALVNLLPALPLDGAHALQGYLTGTCGHRRAHAITMRLTYIWAGSCSVVFLLGMARGSVWPWPAVLAILFWQGARAERRELGWQGLRQVLKRRQLMNRRKLHEIRRFSVQQHCTVNEAIAVLGTSRYYHFDVIDASGRVLGSLSEGSLMEAFFAGMGNHTLDELLP